MPEKRVREYFLDKRGEIAKSDKVSIKPMYVRNINEDLGTLMVEVPPYRRAVLNLCSLPNSRSDYEIRFRTWFVTPER